MPPLWNERKGGSFMIRADSKEDAIDKIEKALDTDNMELIDHRTYSIGRASDYSNEALSKWGDGTSFFDSTGEYIYRVNWEARAFVENSQKRLGI